jgi:uncharacterized OB-fold protein
MIEGTPLPITDDPIDAPFWAAALEGRLVVQRCRGCGKRRFPPRPMCPACQSMELAWEPMSGRGRVWSFVVPHPPLLPSFAAIAPYAVVLVELEDDPSIRMVGNLVPSATGEINEVDPRTVTIGMPVRVVFQTVASDVALPRWIAA